MSSGTCSISGSKTTSIRATSLFGGRARVNTTIGQILGLYRAVEFPNQSFDIGASVRTWVANAKRSLNPGLLPGTIQKSSTIWADPVLVARYRIDLSDRFGLTAYGDVGGFGAGSELTWQALGSLDYRITGSTTVSAGWRYLTFDKTSGGFRLELASTVPSLPRPSDSDPVRGPLSFAAACKMASPGVE